MISPTLVYDPAEDYYDVHAQYQACQFCSAPVGAHTITGVSLWLYRTGTLGAVTIGVKLFKAGKPYGDYLTYTILTADEADAKIPLSTSAWVHTSLPAYRIESILTRYCFVLTESGGSSSHLYWGYSTEVGGATAYYSEDGGSTWSLLLYGGGHCDFLFKEHGIK